MHDGAPAHFIRALPDVLIDTSHGRLIFRGGGGPTSWSPRSPDFNHLGSLPVVRSVDNKEASAHCGCLPDPDVFERKRRFLDETCLGLLRIS
jgi:hypothetical protein